jgi:hypothetical protein
VLDRYFDGVPDAQTLRLITTARDST